MKTNVKLWTGGLVLLLAVLAAPLALAQDDPFEINGDVDNDGVVGPTDIQHVINDALGLSDRGEEAVNLPLRQYIVASPRASLQLRPGVEPGSEEPCDVIGAATNFQRENGRLLVRAGRGIAFRYDRNVEGVWHDGACGLLGTRLSVDIRPLANPDNPESGDGEWRPLGNDGAARRRCGPAVGTAEVVVRHVFENPGNFVVRCTVSTFAIPEREIVAEGETPQFCGAARDVDVVFTHVRVVDRDATEGDLHWQSENDSPAIGSRVGTRLERGQDGEVALP